MSTSHFRFGSGSGDPMASPLTAIGSTSSMLNGGTLGMNGSSRAPSALTILRNGKKKTNGSTHAPASVKFMESTTFLSPESGSPTKGTNALKSVANRFHTPRPPAALSSKPNVPSVSFGETTVLSPLSSEARTTPASKSPLTPLPSNGNDSTPSSTTSSRLTKNAGMTPAPAAFNLARDAGRTPAPTVRVNVEQESENKALTPSVLPRSPVATPPSQNLADNDAWKDTFSASAGTNGARSLFVDRDDFKENNTPLSPEDVVMTSPPANPASSGRKVSFAPQHQLHQPDPTSFGMRQRRSYPANTAIPNGLQGKTPPPRASMSIAMSMMETPMRMDDTHPQHHWNNNQAITKTTISPPQRLPLISGGPLDSFSDDDEWSSWVLVHGFTTREECEFVVRRFQTYGTVLAKNTNRQSGPDHAEPSKWFALQYETPLQAQKALCQNQKFFDCAGSMLVIGVIPVTASLARTLRLGRMDQPPSALFASPSPRNSPWSPQYSLESKGQILQEARQPSSTEELERRRRLAKDPLFRLYAWVGGYDTELFGLLEDQPPSGPKHCPGTPTYVSENDILLHPSPKRPVPRENPLELQVRRRRATSVCGRILAWFYGWDEVYPEIYFDSLSEEVTEGHDNDLSTGIVR